MKILDNDSKSETIPTHIDDANMINFRFAISESPNL